MIYAQIENDTVTRTAAAPTGRGWDHGRWWDFPDELDDWLDVGVWPHPRCPS